jgi:TRAP-type C4-dicarboxylate transport system permease small subunit
MSAMIARLSDYLIRGFLAIAMAALLVMMMAIVADVFMRYVFNSPITGTYDVVEICLVVIVFYSLGAVIAGLHEIVIDIIDQLVSTHRVTLLKRCAASLSAAVLIFIFIAMLKPAMQSYQYGEVRLELNLPVWIIWSIALIGMCGGILASLIRILGIERHTLTTATPGAQVNGESE